MGLLASTRQQRRDVADRPVHAGRHRREGGDGRPRARQHLDLDDHRRPVDEDAPDRARERAVRARFLEVRGYRHLLRERAAESELPSRQGARRRRRRVAPLDRGQVGRQGRHARPPRRRACIRRSRRRPTGSPSRLNILATVGSVAPFVGLFGTVWGIMRSFTDIAGAQNTCARGGRAGHRRGAVRDRDRPVRGDPGGDRLQPLQLRHQPHRGAAAALRRRLPRHASRASWRWRAERWRWARSSAPAGAGGGRRWRRSTSRRWST